MTATRWQPRMWMSSVGAGAARRQPSLGPEPAGVDRRAQLRRWQDADPRCGREDRAAGSARSGRAERPATDTSQRLRAKVMPSPTGSRSKLTRSSATEVVGIERTPRLRLVVCVRGIRHGAAPERIWPAPPRRRGGPAPAHARDRRRRASCRHRHRRGRTRHPRSAAGPARRVPARSAARCAPRAPGLLPAATAHRRPVVIDVERDHPAAAWQRQRHCQGGVAGEAADLQYPGGADQLDQKSPRLCLLGRAAQVRGLGQRIGNLPQLAQHRMLAQTVREHVVVQAVGRLRRAGAHRGDPWLTEGHTLSLSSRPIQAACQIVHPRCHHSRQAACGRRAHSRSLQATGLRHTEVLLALLVIL